MLLINKKIPILCLVDGPSYNSTAASAQRQNFTLTEMWNIKTKILKA